jgi:glycine cleavage system H protein
VSQNLKYTKSHEWIEVEGAVRKVGITDFAQQQLGDIVFVELPEVGRVVNAGDEICVIESTKATASVYAPVPGTIVEVNTPLPDKPELLNEQPTGDGWLVRIEPSGDAPELLDQTAYDAFCKQEEG